MAQPTEPNSNNNNNNNDASISMLYNLDDKSSYEACYKKLKSPLASNFGVRFDNNEATCAVDLTQADVVKWLDERGSRRPTVTASQKTVWLNFWASGSQRDVIKAIAKKYDLSPRLTGLLCPPEKPVRKAASAGGSTTTTTTTATNNSEDGSELAVLAQPGKSSNATSVDVEKGVTPATQNHRQPTTAPQDVPGLRDKLSFGNVVDELWHFNSVDFGSHYIYVGFNALFTVPDVDDDPASTKPAGIRIWSSLLICDDGTLVSVFQQPDVEKPSAYAAARRNVLNVFKHLSTQHDHDSALDALMKVRVRWYERSKKSDEDASYASEAASLLFYYLFDDWLTTYELIARRAHPYRDKLELLRQAMFVSADVNLVSQIHNLGRQLTVLKLMYQSYEHIVSRLLHWQRSKKDANLAMLSSRPTFPLHNDPAAFPELSSSQLVQDERIFLEDESDCRVKLFSSSIVRFERLLGRIRLYALTEIEECLSEKESLVLMNFNLVALKESQAVERLTRTTILLAKATILFLPVSLMTAYFSIQLPEIAEMYSIKTYWLSFLVVALLSIAFLAIFGFTTHTVEGGTIYRSFTTMVLDKGRAGKTKKKKQ
ncbi:uncharacterized protein A1O9_04996 [Exophiala aquamarina CBS 119918]|uniref:ADP-ribosylation factor n=1 Tax=Exophiala aquamarina CBS 119918 TaxID=1182545 RepID=A0A072PJT4_9EURO|nr:uncharacterized protein A1O9_04996 [Exophiala aquamarina CBS 119918]KEF60146.1 hypothetical protein A1O9_04996 [Exophiala aquamarina CBS 119918]